MSGTELAEKAENVPYIQQDKAQATTPAQLLEIAVSNNLDIEKLERLMAMQEQWEAKQAEKAFFEAMSNFQSELPIIKKSKVASFPTKNGGKMTYKFASLDDIAESIKPLLVKNQLSYRFEQEFGENRSIKVICIVTHSLGYSRRTEEVGFPDETGNKNPLQQSASTITYLRRYALTGALGIATADEDIDGRLPQNQKPVKSLSQEQALNIQALLDSKEYPVEDFLKIAKVEKIDDIPAARYENAVSHIQGWSPKS